MPKKKKNATSIKEALETFDTKIVGKWLKRNQPVKYAQYADFNEENKMAVICKSIIDRKDMLATEAHRKAVKWLNEHKMNDGRMF